MKGSIMIVFYMLLMEAEVDKTIHILSS